jgi:mannose-6-phosphate isomerase
LQKSRINREALLDPVLLKVDAFTPLSRTPWAGTFIGERIKDRLCPQMRGKPIGEAWELSCDPAFPSRLQSDETPLLDLIQAYPRETLSPELHERSNGRMELMIKLLNAAEPLSLQVHPADGDPDLKVGECGKPESWLVIDRDPGAGVYIGFSRSMSVDELRDHLERGSLKAEHLQFVPVAPGDFFEIEPGVPHAIGAGVTLLEPQRILPGVSGKTYRLWDWGRRYDVEGRPDQNGRGRPLDIESSLRIVNPERQVGAAFVDKVRRRGERVLLGNQGQVTVYPANPYYQVRWFETRPVDGLTLSVKAGFGAITVLSGELTMTGSGGRELRAPRGQSMFVPATAFPLHVHSAEAAVWALTLPSGATLSL